MSRNRMQQTEQITASANWVKGVTPTPKSWDGEGVELAFYKASEVATVVSIPDPVSWWLLHGIEFEKTEDYVESIYHTLLTSAYGLQTFIQVDPWPVKDEIDDFSFARSDVRKAYTADVLSRVDRYQPNYLCIGMEVGDVYDSDPSDWPSFVSLMATIREEVKKVSPDTMVFVSFQYERLQGLWGYDPQWDLLKDFSRCSDAIGITSYPMTTIDPPMYGAVGDMPANYYKQIADHTDLPIVIAELGWPSDPAFGGSQESQRAFIARLPELLDGLDVRLVNWNFLYDCEGFGKVFYSMGLFYGDGVAKSALEVWNK